MVVNSKSLLTAINAVLPAVGSNAVLPILEGIKFETTDNGCKVTATDMEITLEAFCESTGAIDAVIPSKKLVDTLKALPEQSITLKLSDANVLTIKANKGRYKLSCDESKDYPLSPEVVGTESDLVFHDFADAIVRAIPFASTDELRPAMTGIFFDNGKVVATDAHILCVLPTEFNGSLILPKKAVGVLKSWNSVNVIVTDSEENTNIKVSDGQTTLIARKIDARYPSYTAVVPSWSSYPITIDIDRNDLMQSIKRVGIFANSTTNQVICEFKGNMLELSCMDTDIGSSANETIAIDKIDGDDIRIGFNAKYLLKTLTAIQEDTVRLYLKESMRAGLIYQKSSDETYLLMPVMLS